MLRPKYRVSSIVLFSPLGGYLTPPMGMFVPARQPNIDTTDVAT
jgi:hypothetical protein